MLDIVYRSCEFAEVHPERGARFIDTDRKTLIQKCFKSLTNSIRNAGGDIRLWILDDHSSQELIDFFYQECYNIQYTVVSLDEGGYNYSALKQFEYCSAIGKEWIYSVEDDYLHFPEAISIMLKEAEIFKQMFGTNIAIRPDDDVFTYSLNTEYAQKPYRIFLGSDRHWRTLHNTHNTIFTHVNVIREYWELFAALAKFFRKTRVNEDGTINTLWSDGATAHGPVPLFSPIPTLAIHISQNNEPHTVDYMKLWESL